MLRYPLARNSHYGTTPGWAKDVDTLAWWRFAEPDLTWERETNRQLREEIWKARRAAKDLQMCVDACERTRYIAFLEDKKAWALSITEYVDAILERVRQRQDAEWFRAAKAKADAAAKKMERDKLRIERELFAGRGLLRGRR